MALVLHRGTSIVFSSGGASGVGVASEEGMASGLWSEFD